MNSPAKRAIVIGMDGDFAGGMFDPALFIEIFPTWIAALLGVGVLSAIMSTADGLVISTSQVFANDIYRRSIAPRIHADLDQAKLDRNVLMISRAMTAFTVVGAAILGSRRAKHDSS